MKSGGKNPAVTPNSQNKMKHCYIWRKKSHHKIYPSNGVGRPGMCLPHNITHETPKCSLFSHHTIKYVLVAIKVFALAGRAVTPKTAVAIFHSIYPKHIDTFKRDVKQFLDSNNGTAAHINLLTMQWLILCA